MTVIEKKLTDLLVKFQVDQLVEDWEELRTKIIKAFVAEGFVDV